MTTHPTFTDDADLAAIADGVIARTLPKPAWTHAAHFAAAVWIVLRRPDLDPERDMPGLIRAYNEATETPNTDTGGYHETITQASIGAVRAVIAALPPETPPHAVLNALLADRYGDKHWPLAYWSRERLSSVEARRGWVEPDLEPLPFALPPQA
ncbi:MAG TPA: hypothetical protein PLF78_06395 [Caulobacter sp.]|nr:hypothetical protein [Caulobacter sp.]